MRRGVKARRVYDREVRGDSENKDLAVFLAGDFNSFPD